jgi:hypothetical protein
VHGEGELETSTPFRAAVGSAALPWDPRGQGDP